LSAGEITEDRFNGPGPGLPGFPMSEQLAQSIRVLRRRWRIILAVPFLALVVSLLLSERSPTEYTATAKVIISPYNPVTSLLEPGSTPTSADPERDLNTEVSEITETPMAQMVRKSLRLRESSSELLGQVSAELEGTTNIVDISAEDGDGARAATIANAFAAQYVVFRLALLRSSIEGAAALDQQKLNALSATQRSSPSGQQLQDDLSTLQANSAVLTSDAQVSQAAVTPTSPTSPKPLLDAIIAIVVGLAIAIVAVIVLELLDRAVRDEDDASAAARLKSLGMIPKPRSQIADAARGELRSLAVGDRLRSRLPQRSTEARNGVERSARHALTSVATRSDDRRPPDWEVDESFGALAVSLLALRLGPGENVLMITSPGPQDGKTSVTLGLAAGLAELGQRVTVVEGDMRRPRFAAQLGLPASAAGLSSILAGDTLLPSGLVEVDVGSRGRESRSSLSSGNGTARARGRTFTVLPCGPIPARPLALLHGSELRPLLRELQSDADVVLVDTPPLGAIKDAVVLAETVDHVMLVARVGHTRRDALARCRDAIDQLASPLLGIVTVGGARGGALDYYFRPEFEGWAPAAGEPELFEVRERVARAAAREATQPAQQSKRHPVAAAAKRDRARRPSGADSSD
jgi:Mrp family chromosome partitioning ATPase/capsular polysaccharide biosynthesis protein